MKDIRLASKASGKIDAIFNPGDFIFIAGPCTVESEEQCFRIAEFLSGKGIKFFRGGAFKPRTSPYNFQGMGVEGLKILDKVKQSFDLNIVTEIMDTKNVDAVSEVADIIQIGARNMQNTPLLREVAHTSKPILLKRNFSATVDELLLAAEYILKEGNEKVILCERGIRTFEKSTRFTLDVGAFSVVKKQTRLPIIADPSHPAGRAELVLPLARAAVAAGADGLIVEVHNEPDSALCDAEQALTFEMFGTLQKEAHELLNLRNKRF